MVENSSVYSFDNKPRIPVVVVHCLDGRFVRQTQDFITKELGLLVYTPYTFPGGPKIYNDARTRNVFLSALAEVSVGEHKVERVILIAHRDCKAWGGSAAFASLKEERATLESDMRAARETLHRLHPEIEVELYYLEIVRLINDDGKVQFQLVR
jgi:hypothetical protein